MSKEAEKQLQQTGVSSPDASLDRIKLQKELVEKLKGEWKLLWSERFDDRVRAEGISVGDYASLHVERGTIIHATRDFKALNFKEILDQNTTEHFERYLTPDVNVGGWSKFVKTKITNPMPKKMCQMPCAPKKRLVQQPKKGGRGWLHAT